MIQPSEAINIHRIVFFTLPKASIQVFVYSYFEVKNTLIPRKIQTIAREREGTPDNNRVEAREKNR
jgi:hypothetical protein